NARAEFRLPDPAARVRVEPVRIGAAKFDLSFNLEELRSAGGALAGIKGEVGYATDLFDRGTVVAMADRFVRLLTAVVADPDRRIGGVDILDTAERRQLLEGWND